MSNFRLPLPSAETIRSLFDYDPLTGILTRRRRSGNRIAGTKIASANRNGYIIVGIDGVSYYAHRIIWKWICGSDPPLDLDHRDNVRSNNRIENLRTANPTQQTWNALRYASNRCGHKGVHFNKQKSKWAAVIRVHRKQRWLGFFDTPEEAHTAYVAEAKRHFGEFANGGEQG